MLVVERDRFVVPLCAVLSFDSVLLFEFGLDDAVLDDAFPAFSTLSCAGGLGYTVRERVFLVVERVTTGMTRGMVALELNKWMCVAKTFVRDAMAKKIEVVRLQEGLIFGVSAC